MTIQPARTGQQGRQMGMIMDMTNSDRCDKCGAQAFIRAVFPDSDLMFCAHHGRESTEKLRAVALFIEDSTETINKKPSVAAF